SVVTFMLERAQPQETFLQEIAKSVHWPDEEPSIHTAPVPRADDPYVVVRDAALDTRGDEDVDTDAPRDTQPFEPRGSPRNSQ
nr:hypothetical protein [Tanacetum cinerariifolium]